MKKYILKLIKGVSFFALIVVILLSSFSPAAFAAEETHIYAEVVASYINVREGPGLSYSVVTQYAMGSRFYANEGDYIEADGYKWYVCPDGFIAQTGGLKFVDYTISTDTLTAFDTYGSVAWEHTCEVDSDSCFDLELLTDRYHVRCSCGWWYTRYVLPFSITDPDGKPVNRAVFLGLDTDNDECIDLRPGDTAVLPHRYYSNLRPYQILEFFGDENIDIPTVTVNLYDSTGVLLKQVDCYWNAFISVVDDGPFGTIFVEDKYGNTLSYTPLTDFIVFDRTSGDFLGSDVVKHSVPVQDGYYTRHVVIDLVVEKIAESGPSTVSGWIKYLMETIKEDGVFFFSDGLGLFSHLTDGGNPFDFIINFVDVAEVFTVVRTFISALPTPVMMVSFVSVICILIVALMRWL